MLQLFTWALVYCWVFSAHANGTIDWTSKKADRKLVSKYNSLYKNPFYSSSGIHPYRQNGYRIDNSYLRHPLPLDEEFQLDDLLNLIRKKDLRSIEDVIAALPYEMKNDNYVLMYRSRSLQAASPTEPRAILYSPTAQFVLSFNGGPEQRGGQALELMQFDQDEKSFEFREIVFDEKNPPKVSPANPSQCMECHQAPSRKGTDMRPNWEPYSIWLGAFGSNTGGLRAHPLGQRFDWQGRIRPEDKEVLLEQAREVSHFQNYIENVAPNHPRYSQLGNMNIGAPTDITNHLAIWNSFRVMRLIAQEKEIYALMAKPLAYFLRCYTSSDFLPETPGISWLKKNTDHPYYIGPETSKLSTLSYRLALLFESIGLDTSDWSMDFGSQGRHAFRERFGAPSDINSFFREAWRQTFPEAESLLQLNCQQLKPQALAILDKAYQSGKLQELRSHNLAKIENMDQPLPSLLNRCASCHSGQQSHSIPHIPFDQPDKLAAALDTRLGDNSSLFQHILYRTSDQATRDEQMPPLGRLTPRERKTLVDYLEALKTNSKKKGTSF